MISELKQQRNALIQSYRDAPDCQARDAICLELYGLFERRGDWANRHKRSYTWAIERNVIPRLQKNATKEKNQISDIAKFRDLLHNWAVRNGFDYYAEIYAGEMFKRQVESGNTIEMALACAKASLENGMHNDRTATA